MQPYIGVTGFTSRMQVEEVLAAHKARSKRLLMVGVLASWKTLHGGTNKWPMRYPRAESIPDIFTDDPQTLNLIHFNTKETQVPLGDQLVEVMYAGGPRCHGIQMNIAWPSPEQLGSFRVTKPDAVLVLQIGGAAFEAVGSDPLKLAAKVADYGDLVDYVLLDPSGGLGKPFDSELQGNFLAALANAKVSPKSGVAGGLSAETLDLVRLVAICFPEVSIDAEGRLRTKPGDLLDLESTKNYVIKAAEILG